MTLALSSSESTKKIYESGFRGFSTLGSEAPGASTLAFKLIDFDQLLQQPQPRKLIQALPPQLLYHSLLARGVYDCLEVLPHLSQEQFVRICDYDVWDDDRLVAKRLFAWLELYREISSAQMYARFRSLDEEYQLAVMAPRVRLYTPEEYEKMSDQQQDSLYRMPGDAMFYAIDSEEQEIHQGIEHLIDASMAEDMNYTISLLSHSSYQLVGEAELLMQQFRKARLEEDGFVSYEESMELFIPLRWQEVLAKWPVLVEQVEQAAGTAVAEARAEQGIFLQQVIQQGIRSGWSAAKIADLHTSFLYLSNALCTACHIDADDLHGLTRLLSHSQGLCSLALEVLSAGDVERASTILAVETPKQLLRLGLALVAQLSQEVVTVFLDAKVHGAEELAKYYRAHKTGALLDHLDREMLSVLGFDYVELLKGLFNRLPLLPQELAQSSEGAAPRMVFAPLVSRRHLLQGKEQVAQLLGKIRQAAKNSQGKTIDNLDRCL
jgi:hypothetical protein